MTNPLSLLTDLIPTEYRRYLYALTAGALFVYSLWEVSNGDVKSFLIALGSALVATLATANTPASKAEVTEAAVELIEDEPQVVADAVEAYGGDVLDEEYGNHLDGHGYEVGNRPGDGRGNAPLF